jgi:hypothetical protein
MADCEIPEYCSSPSLSGLNLRGQSAVNVTARVMRALLDGKLSNAAILAFGFVDTAIGTAANEAHDLVALIDPLLGVVASEHGLCGVGRI